MKTLFFVRHAKSSWKNPELVDRERPLNDRGKRDAPFMGKLLRERGVKPDLIICSPAKRATGTVRFIAHELKYRLTDVITDESLYPGTMDDILTVIHGIKNTLSTVIIVGHNPAITSCSNFITNTNIEKIPTCGILCLDFAFDEWGKSGGGSGVIRYFEYPKKYFK